MDPFTNIKYLSYKKYIDRVNESLIDGSLNNSSEYDLVSFTQLSLKRMQRLDKTIVLENDVKLLINNLKGKYVFYVISEGWCGDASQILPVINMLTEYSEKLNMRIILRDENLDIIDLYLTNGSRAIPKVIIFNEKNDQIAVWGPRPKVATDLFFSLKEKFGKVNDDIIETMQKWYNTDKGVEIQKEILALLK